MPLSFRYDPYRDLLINIGDGPVTLEDIADLRAARASAGVPEYVRHTLNDMRRVHFEFDIADLKASESGRPADDYAGMRQAEIVTDPKTTAVLLIWRNWLPKDVLVEVFSTAEAAFEWLGVEERPGDLDP